MKIGKKASMAVAALILANSCGAEEKQNVADGARETVISGTVELLVDDALAPMLDSLLPKYRASFPEAKVTLTSVSSRQAMIQLLSGNSRGVILARGYAADEDSAMTYHKVPKHPAVAFARDALVFFVAKNSPIDTVSKDQLQEVLLSTGRSSTLPGAQKELPFAVRSTESAEYMLLLEMLKARSWQLKAPIKNYDTFAEVKEAALSGSAIGVGLLSQIASDTNVRALRIGFWRDSLDQQRPAGYVYPALVHQANIVQDKYPYITTLTGFLLEDLNNSLPRGFFQYLRNDTTATYFFKNAGIVPSNVVFRLVQQ